MKPIILASASPRRKKLLQQINLEFQVHASNVTEGYDSSLSPAEVVQTLAQRKALDVAQRYHEALIIGADTIVAHKDTILEKPATYEAAEQMLHELSGSTHSVLTGVTLCQNTFGKDQRVHTFFEETHVTFGKLRSEDITQYVQSGSPMDKAGSYGIQDDFGAIFVKRIEGDYNTVVGLPLYAFYQSMIQFAPEFLATNHPTKQ
ncbi:Maf family protein [Fodinibius salsisoli]|uniref:dTTP/UTP pyrophosphatase n=1 Tax=Fodinibius salsisoli TaxID=2820877 RepID=A0ABT3PND1_9BACT|nr:Maf family protein [Fodinibius salsisoli]MCW9706824.1 septum formation protein Maf [Fodinibius salsisoli]